MSHREKLKILVAEDNTLNQKLIGHLITGWNMTSVVCDNGKVIVQKLRDGNYDLVIMDLQMPEMDGYEATKAIRVGLQSDIPIIALTAHESDDEKQKCFNAGMNGYITKPFEARTLHDAITGLLLNSGIHK
jgi:CheY-like chemotaxis protein